MTREEFVKYKDHFSESMIDYDDFVVIKDFVGEVGVKVVAIMNGKKNVHIEELDLDKYLADQEALREARKDEAYKNLAKRERLTITREKEKLERVLGGIADLTRLPAALFIVDVKREHIAVKEAKKLNIPVFAMVDTNSDPSNIDFPIPANDDAFKSIDIITKYIGSAIEEGLQERKKDKEESQRKEEEAAKRKVDEAPEKEVAGKA